MQKSRRLTFIIALLLTFLGQPLLCVVRAQTTRHAQLMDRVRWCNAHVDDPGTLSILDSLIDVGLRCNDDTVVMHSKVLRVTHYYQKRDEKNILEEFNRTISWCEPRRLDYGMFVAWGRVVMHYINAKHTPKVSEQLRRMREKAEQMHSAYGLVQSYNIEGAFLSNAKLHSSALDCFLKAEEIARANKGKPNINLSYVNIMLGQTYMQLKDYRNAIRHFEIAKQDAAGMADRLVGAYIYSFRTYVLMQDAEKAREQMDWIKTNFPRRRMLFGMRRVYDTARIEYYVMEGKLDSAEIVLSGIRDSLKYLELQHMITANRGDYKLAKQQLRQYSDYSDSVNRIAIASHLQQLLDSTVAQELYFNNLLLEHENKQLQLSQAENEKSLQRQLHIQDSLRMLQMHMAIDAEDKEHERLRLETEEKGRERILEDEINHQRDRTRRHIIIAGSVLVFFVWILIGLTFISIMKILAQKRKARKAMERAQLTDRMKSVFLQNMNHEIRAPLASIVSFSDLLNSPEIQLSPEERKDLQQNLHVNTELLLTLLNDVIDLTTFQSGNYKVQQTDVPLNMLCHTAVAGMSMRCQPGVEMHCNVPTDETVIHTDYNRLLQVINNLLSNACKYTAQGSISLGYTRRDGFVEFSVADTGSGIPSDQALNIFNRFEKIGSVKKGFGLGLSICQSVVGLLGGTIWLDTSYTEGACFRFRLPMSMDVKPETDDVPSGRLATLICAIAFMLAPLSALSQNNPFLISDELYPYYVKTQTAVRTKGGLEMTDTLISLAKAHKDAKAEVMGHVCRYDYYYYQMTSPESLEKANRDLVSFARTTDYQQYCFHGYNGLVARSLNKYDFSRARRYLNEMTKLAFDLDNAYGITRSYARLGDYYLQLNLWSYAIREYHKALDVCSERGETRDVSGLYCSLVQCYLNMKDFPRAKENVEKAILTSKAEIQFKSAYLGALNYSARSKNMEYGRHYVDSIYALPNISLNTRERNIIYFYLGNYYLSHSQPGLAQTYLDSISAAAENSSNILRYRIQEQLGQERESYETLLEMSNRQDSINNTRNSTSIQDFSFDIERRKQEITHEELDMQRQEMLLFAAQHDEALLNAEHERDSLLLLARAMELEAGRKSTEAERTAQQLMQQENQKHRELRDELEHTHSLRLRIFIAFSLMAVLSLIVLLFLRRRFLISKAKVTEAQHQAEEADRLKALFLQDMNHEIRTPLNSIVGYTDLLNQQEGLDVSEEELRSMNHIVHEQSSLLLKLVNEILDLSKLESGTNVFAENTIQLDRLCNEAADEIRHELSAGVELILDLPVSSSTYVGDRKRLLQVLCNVLRNAAQHTSVGYVKLSCTAMDGKGGKDSVRFQVTDSGKGIPEGEEERIFRRFYKLDQFAVGFGLGLSTCQVILTQLGGSIHVEPRQLGACFVIDVPLRRV